MSWKPILHVSFAAFFLLAGYECVRSPSNALFQKAFGAENFPLVMSFLPLVLIGAVSIYNLLLTRLGPRRTVLTITLSSLVILAGCQFALARGFAIASAVLYLFRETYVTLIIEQYWSYLDSIQGESSAKKFNSIFMGMVSLGAMVGAVIVANLAQRVGTINLPLLACVITLPAVFFANRAFRLTGEPKAEPRVHSEESRFGLELFGELPTLRLLFVLVVASQVVSTILYLVFQSRLQIALPRLDAQTEFSGYFYAALNFGSLAFQFVVTPLVLTRIPGRAVQLVIPAVHVTTAVLLLAAPSLETAALAFASFKALDYSLFRASKELLYIPMPFDARYRAKEWIDVVGYRLSKGFSSMGLVLLQRVGLAGQSVYPYAVMGACAVWFVIAEKLSAQPRLRKA